MSTTKKNGGLVVGSTFTVVSLLLTFTFAVPIISVLPGAILESAAKHFIADDPYSNIGKATIGILLLLLVVAATLILRDVHSRAKGNYIVPKALIAFFMAALWFIVHPLCFYIYWGLFLDFSSDGQMIFAALYTFPCSSFAFILFGLLIDWTIRTGTNKAPKQAEHPLANSWFPAVRSLVLRTII